MHFEFNFPFSGLFLSFSAHLSTNNMWNKIHLYCYFPMEWPFSFCVLKGDLNTSVFPDYTQDSAEKLKKKKNHKP